MKQEKTEILKTVILGTIILLAIILSLLLVSKISEPSPEIPAPVLHSGDFWEYEVMETEEALVIEGTETFTVTGIDEVNVGGVKNSVFVMHLSGSGTFYGFSAMSGTWTENGVYYYRLSDLLPVKSDVDLEMSGMSSFYNYGQVKISAQNVSDYNIISSSWRYSLKVGDQGLYNLKVSANASYRIDMPSGYEDYNTTENSTYYEEWAFWCQKKVKVTVPAGTFDTYLIKRTLQKDGSYYLLWYSPEVGNHVKIEHYNEDGSKNLDKELNSYSYRGAPNNFVVENLPYILIIVTVAVIVILIFMRIRKKPESEV